MRKSSGILMAVCLFAATPALAGSLALEGGKNVWIPTQCAKPTPPASVLGVSPETSGRDMNALSAQQNAFVDAMQAYMNCISSDAQNDQALIGQTITSSAQSLISAAMAEIDNVTGSMRGHQR